VTTITVTLPASSTEPSILVVHVPELFTLTFCSRDCVVKFCGYERAAKRIVVHDRYEFDETCHICHAEIPATPSDFVRGWWVGGGGGGG
jgi:hypothetical protein